MKKAAPAKDFSRRGVSAERRISNLSNDVWD